MSRQIQIRRGTASEHESFTGAIGEVTMDTTNNTLRVHDGVTAGGIVLARADAVPDTVTIPENYDFVIETYRAADGATWYRKYKSGWIEQGGYINNSGNKSAAFVTVRMPVQMIDIYSIVTTCRSAYTNSSGSSHAYVMEKSAVVNNVTSTDFQIFMQDSSSNVNTYWNVCGIAAI